MSKNTEKYNNGRSRKENAANESREFKFSGKSDKQIILECIAKSRLKTPVFEEVDLDAYVDDKQRIAANTAAMNKMSLSASLKKINATLDGYTGVKDINPDKLKTLDKLVDGGVITGYSVWKNMDVTNFNRLIMSDVNFKTIYNGTIKNVIENDDSSQNTYVVSVDLDHLKGVRLLMTRNNMMRNLQIGDNEYQPGDKISVSFFRSAVGKVYPSEKAASRLKQLTYNFEPDMVLDNVTIIKTGKLNCVQIHDYNDVRCMLENGSQFKYETGDILNIKLTSVKIDDTGVVLSGVSIK